MSINPSYLEKFVVSTAKAAVGAYPFIGKNDKKLVDKGAVDEMRKELNSIDMKGKVVIGEGEMDDAPMLYIGEKLGTNNGQEFDIAVDPIEGTNFVAKNLPNAISVIAVTKKNCLLAAPDTYMEKIAIGPNPKKNLLDLDNTVEKNIRLLSESINKPINEITACVLERPRHNKIIKSLKELGVAIKFITDGDITPAIETCEPQSGIDIYMGIGGAPEGVLAAAALSALGGQIQGRFVFKDQKEIDRAHSMGIKDINKKYYTDDMVKGDVIFSASAITNCSLLNGVKKENKTFTVSSLAIHKSANIKKRVKSTFFYE